MIRFSLKNLVFLSRKNDFRCFLFFRPRTHPAPPGHLRDPRRSCAPRLGSDAAAKMLSPTASCPRATQVLLRPVCPSMSPRLFRSNPCGRPRGITLTGCPTIQRSSWIPRAPGCTSGSNAPSKLVMAKVEEPELLSTRGTFDLSDVAIVEVTAGMLHIHMGSPVKQMVLYRF